MPQDTLKNCFFVKLSILCKYNTDLSLQLGTVFMLEWFEGQFFNKQNKNISLKMVRYKEWTEKVQMYKKSLENCLNHF